MIEITQDSVRQGLKALVEEFGEDFIYRKRQGLLYEKCVYVHAGKPDCIVGRYLASQGVPIERLISADEAEYGNGMSSNGLLDALEDEGVVHVDQVASAALWRAQLAQDDGLPWGVALRHALEYMGE